MPRAALFLAFLAISIPLLAEESAPSRVVDGMKCAADPEMTYAWFLPDGYTKEQRWPVLFVFDPRSRGKMAAELFEEAARDRGWIVVSSNNTRSDESFEPNARAVNAMWYDVHQRFSVDRTRIYAAGFSGGAILSWVLGENTKGLAGIISVGGRAPDNRAKGPVPFDWIGIAGSTDFNLIETQIVEERLAAANGMRRLEIFEGGHRWAPEEMLRDAVEWHEVLAMKRNLRSRDDAFIKRILGEEMAAAAASPDELVAMRRYDTIVRTFDGVAEVSDARKRAGALRGSKSVRALEADERRGRKLEELWRSRLPPILRQVKEGEDVPAIPQLVHDLQIGSLKKQAEAKTYTGTAAARVLATMYVQFDFYLARELSGARQTVAKAVADVIRGDSH